MFKLSSCLQIKVRIYTEKKKKKKVFWEDSFLKITSMTD